MQHAAIMLGKIFYSPAPEQTRVVFDDSFEALVGDRKIEADVVSEVPDVLLIVDVGEGHDNVEKRGAVGGIRKL